MDGSKPSSGPWVHDAECREVVPTEPFKQKPEFQHVGPLRASAQVLEPEPLDAMHEKAEIRETGGDSEVSQPPANDRPQPKGYVLRVVVPASAQSLTDPFQRPLHPFRLWFPPETEPALPRGSAVMREPEEGEGFGTTFAAGTAARHGEPAELDAAGLVRVEGQAEAGQPLP